MMMAQALSSPISFFSATRSGPPGAPRCSPPAIVCPRHSAPRCAHAPPPAGLRGGPRVGREGVAGARRDEAEAAPAPLGAERSGHCSPAYVAAW